MVDPSRIVFKDYAGFCNILLDGKQSKPICRFYFNNPKAMKLSFFDKGGYSTEEKFPISSLNDIYRHSDRVKARLQLHLTKPAATRDCEVSR